jgi:ZIP family zinc transporter
MLILIAAATGTALATGLGAIPVFFLGQRAEVLRPALLGLAAGVMTVASIAGLLIPGLDNGSAVAVAGGLLVGVGFLLSVRRFVGDEHRGRW